MLATFVMRSYILAGLSVVIEALSFFSTGWIRYRISEDGVDLRFWRKSYCRQFTWAEICRVERRELPFRSPSHLPNEEYFVVVTSSDTEIADTVKENLENTGIALIPCNEATRRCFVYYSQRKTNFECSFICHKGK
jgi:hypothetical protein